MNLPKDFPALDALLKKMGARFVEEIDIILIDTGVIVRPEIFVIVDDIPTIEKRKVALYLNDAWRYNNMYNDFPKYHIVNCKTLQDMRQYGHYNRYCSTHRTDGKFFVKLSASEELSLHKLHLCKNCLEKLNIMYGANVFPQDTENFPLADWFEVFDVNENLEEIEGLDAEFDYLSESWKKRSLECREKANWTCQECGINLKKDHHLLHAHHQWGTQFNDPHDLIALCIRCHAEQPGHGHSLLKFRATYPEFQRKYGNDSTSNQSLNLQVSQLRENSSNSSDNYLISDYTEEDDIPF